MHPQFQSGQQNDNLRPSGLTPEVCKIFGSDLFESAPDKEIDIGHSRILFGTQYPKMYLAQFNPLFLVCQPENRTGAIHRMTKHFGRGCVIRSADMVNPNAW